MSKPADRNSNPSAAPDVPPTVDHGAPTPVPIDSGTLLQPRPSAVTPITTEGIQVPGYEVQGELGRGGMGVVYLAKNLLMKRPVVLKVVNKALLNANPGMLDRFVREIEVAARLDHENVVKAYHAFWAGELLVFEMEYIEGEDLAKLVKRQGPLPVAHACHYVSQAAMGLQAAHLLHMVHRDIKPHNLILTRRGKRHVVKILDFGLAKAVQADESAADLTGLGMLGTPAFMAPEQAVDAARADIRADIYGLGCTLYFLLTGAPPFSGNNHFAVMKAHESAEVPSLSHLRAGTPTDLAAVAAKMLAKDPAKRYQQPIDVAKALAPIIKAAPQAPKEKPPVPVAKVEPAPAKPSVVSPSIYDKPTVAPMRRDASVPVARRESETETVVRPPPKTTGPAPSGRSFSGAWLMGVAGVIGIVFLAAVGGAGLLFSGPAPSTSPVLLRDPPKLPPTDNLVPVSEPARAVAPFGAAQAKQFQKAWAEYLHVQVVREVNLGGGTTMKLTLIPPGTFQMGSPETETGHSKDEGPQHRVEITQPFYMGVYPVTKEQFAAFVQDAAYQTEAEMAGEAQTWRKPGGSFWQAGYVQTDDDPVVDVTWNDGVKFCDWLSKKEKKTYQLLTEAQWEYACRAGTQTMYSFGDDAKDLDDYAWYSHNSEGHTHPAGGKKPNPWGLCDMQGNVWEWCQDYYDAYSGAEEKDPIKVLKGPNDARVLRGGCWTYAAGDCRAACRVKGAPGSRFSNGGLRVCFRLD
jgi:formylglycine-generating enzyme required for sulfatase activity/serine/threonine protein kinase